MSSDDPFGSSLPSRVGRWLEPRGSVAVAPPDGNARDGAAQVQGIDWRRAVAALWRLKWAVAGITLLGTAAGVGVSRFIAPTYAARATLWVDMPDVRTRDEGPLQTSQLVGPAGWGDLLESHLVLDEVVRNLHLYLTVQKAGDTTAFASFGVTPNVRPGTYRLAITPTGAWFTLTTAGGEVVQTGAVGDSVGASVGFVWAPSKDVLPVGRAIEFTVAAPGAAAAQLAEQLRVRTDLMEGKVGNFMTVELRGSRPLVVTAVVNAIAERFVTVAWDLRRQKLTELVKILSEQMEHAQANLAAAERALRNFRVGSVTALSADARRDPAFTQFFEMKVTREQLRRDQAALDGILAQLPNSASALDALEAIGAVERSSALTQALHERTQKLAELRALRYRYTEAYPPLRRLSEEVGVLERRTIPALAQGLSDQLAARQGALAQELDAMAGGLREIPPLAVQDTRLEREVTIAAQLFANIQQRYEEVRLSDVSSLPEVRILDRAVSPERPLFNATPTLIAIAFMGSLVAAGVAVVMFDRFDPRVRYVDQVTGAMGLTILGAVPHVDRPEGDGAEVLAVIEALRAVRLRVVHAHGAGPVVLTVSSPGRSDGKSFVTSNLALAFADAGFRTLLIDGDVRRGRLHRLMKANRQPGLTELLGEEVSLDQAIQATPYPSLWFIGCGTRTHNGPELLSSARMARLATDLRQRYDVILVDSPPLAAGVDAFALGTMTGALLLVLRTGFSNREMAEAKLDVLDRLPVRLLGAVLNDVRADGEYRYYSYYLAGYEVVDEQPRWRGRPVLRQSD